MKKQPYAELLAERDRLDRRAHVLEIAYTEAPDGHYTHQSGADLYHWSAYRLAGPAGGWIVMIAELALNKRKHVGIVELLDVLNLDTHADDAGTREACARFLRRRFELERKTA